MSASATASAPCRPARAWTMTPLVRGTPSASSARTDGATRSIEAWTAAEPVKVAGLARLAVGLRGLVGMRVRRWGAVLPEHGHAATPAHPAWHKARFYSQPSPPARVSGWLLSRGPELLVGGARPRERADREDLVHPRPVVEVA